MIKISILLSFLWMLLLIPLTSNASNDTDVNSTDSVGMRLALDGVEVVGAKEGRELFNLPVSGSSLTGYAMRNNGISSIKEISSYVPNFFMPDYGTKLTSPIYVRGIGAKINSPSVGLYVDGIPYFEKSVFDFNFGSIDRVEVLRGPQGTLYGRNTMGGVINVSTRSPFSGEGHEVRVGVGDYNSQSVSFSNSTLLSDKFGFVLNANYLHRGGYIRNVTLNEMADKEHSGGANIKLHYKGERWDFQLSSLYDQSYESGYPYGMLDSVGNVSAVNYNRSSSYRRLMSSNGLLLSYKGDRFKMVSRSAYQYVDGKQHIDQDFLPVDMYYVTQDEDYQTFSEDITFHGVNTRWMDWTLGAMGFYQTMNRQVVMNYLEKSPMPGLTTDKYYDTPTWGGALYGEVRLKRLGVKGLSLTLGGRYDVEHSSNDYEYYKGKNEPYVLADSFSTSLKANQFSPKFAIEYAWERGLTYATVSRGFKAGGFNSSFVTEDERTFDPEHNWSYEIGMKLRAPNGAYEFTTALFYIDWWDQQIYQPLSTGRGSLLTNAGKSVSKGVEMTFNWRIFPGLNWNNAYGYTHATFSRYEKGEDNYAGNYLPYAPRNTVSSQLSYAKSSKCSWIDYWRVGLGYNGVGQLYWNDANTHKQDFYGTINANASVTKGAFTLSTWVKNVFNKSYNAYYFEAMGNSFVQPGDPRDFAVEMTFQF